MKIISWNVNGLRACLEKGFVESVARLAPDVVCLQEIKLSEPSDDMIPSGGYKGYWNCAEKKGYSGTALFTRLEPMSVTYGLGIPEHDREGRVITAEYEGMYLVVCYTPNAQRGLARLDYRMRWEDDFRAYLADLDSRKPVVLCGDLNVAHKTIDLKNPAANRKNAGFTDEERAKFSLLLESGFVDTFRHFHPDLKDQYTWWSYMGDARARNVGWRIDYFCASPRLMSSVVRSKIHPDIYGSDHCPVELALTK